MRTEFTAEQLADPQIATSNEILRKCVHCGFCTATCPTYVLLGDELDSPRGRIYLIKNMLEDGGPATGEVVKHVDRCLSCLACMTTCPASVDYMHLVDHARVHIEKTYRRPLAERLIRRFIAATLPEPKRARPLMRLGAAVRPLAPILQRLPVTRPLAAMLGLMPKALPPSQAALGPGVYAAEGERRARVALLAGCVQIVIAPHIGRATVRLLNRLGTEVVIPATAGCCGALVHHLGREDEAHAHARTDIDSWTGELDRGLDAVISDASGCGTMIKDYGFIFRNDPQYAEKAARISDLAMDVSEFVDRLGLGPATAAEPLRVAYHSACSMQHGQRVHAQPVSLLRRAGFEVLEVPEGHLCCGSAGTYNILQPELSRQLRDRKIDRITGIRPDVVATGNIGCISQLSPATDIPFVHTVELLDWATGGPRPQALQNVKRNSA